MVGIWDTRNNKAVEDALASTHIVHRFTAPRNTPGSGGVVLISKRITAHCFFRGFHANVCLGWVAAGDVHIGFVYVPHHVTQDARGLANYVAAVQADVLRKQDLGPVVLVGDLNARLGRLTDASDMPREVVAACAAHDPAGALWMDTATAVGLATMTGRGTDGGEPSWERVEQRRDPPCVRTLHSRIDHAFVSCELLHSSRVWCDVHKDLFGSDHYPLFVTITLHIGSGAGATPYQRPRLRWEQTPMRALSMHMQCISKVISCNAYMKL